MPVETLLIYLHYRLARAMPGYVTAGSRLCIRTSRDDSTSCRLLFPTPEKPLVPPQAYACGCGAEFRAISGTEAELTPPPPPQTATQPPHHGGSPSRGLPFPPTPPPAASPRSREVWCGARRRGRRWAPRARCGWGCPRLPPPSWLRRRAPGGAGRGEERAGACLCV